MKGLRQPRKNILSRDDANAILGPHYDDLFRSVQEGLTQFMRLPNHHRERAMPRTLSGLLNDCIWFDAKQRFGSTHGVRIIEECKSYFLVFNEKAALRFKKVDAALVPRNVPTRRQLKATYQQLELPGIELPTIVNVGYEPNLIFTEIKSLSLSCRRGGRVVWEIPLADSVPYYLFDHEGDAQPINSPVVRPRIVGEVANG